MDSERTRAQKVILWILLAMAVVFTVVNIVLKFFPGVSFEDTLLKITQNGDTTLYTGEKYGYDITISVTPETNGSRVELTIGDYLCHVYRVTYPGGTIAGQYGTTYDRITITLDSGSADGATVLFDGGYNPNVSTWGTYCDLNGGFDFPAYSRVYYTNSNPWYGYELHYSRVMGFANGPAPATRGSWIHYGIALFGSILCAVAVAFPYTLFELRHRWSVRDPEPTEFYLRVNEVSCGFVAAVLLVIYLIGVTRIV